MAAVANPHDADQAFAEGVKKSSKEADAMEHGDKLESPGILATLVDKAGDVVHKVAEAAHKLVGDDPPTENQLDPNDPPTEGKDTKNEASIPARTKEAAEFYAERASEKYDSENSSLSSYSRKSTESNSQRSK